MASALCVTVAVQEGLPYRFRPAARFAAETSSIWRTSVSCSRCHNSCHVGRCHAQHVCRGLGETHKVTLRGIRQSSIGYLEGIDSTISNLAAAEREWGSPSESDECPETRQLRKHLQHLVEDSVVLMKPPLFAKIVSRKLLFQRCC